MEALNSLVTDSLVRHGFDRPIDPRRLQWSRWYPCDSPRSLLVVPSKPGIFAIAEEICGAADPFVRPSKWEGQDHEAKDREGHDFSRADMRPKNDTALAAEGTRRTLAVLQFSEADDMAFTLDRMFTRPNPMRDRLASGHCFLRYVALADGAHRRSICAALNQWMASSADKAVGFEEEGFVGRAFLSAPANSVKQPSQAPKPTPLNVPDSGSNKNIHCPQPLPSGF